MKIYTLGTSNRSQREFLEILGRYRIEAVADVRHFPTSRLFPHFKKENLEKLLHLSEIKSQLKPKRQERFMAIQEFRI